MKTKRVYSERRLIRALEKNKDKAKAYLNDDEKMEKLFRDFEDKLKLIPEVGTRASDIAVMLSMVRAYIKKQYMEVPIATILFSIAALIYVVAPIDLIPDFIPGAGLIDDAGAIGIVLQAIHVDLGKYKQWQKENGKR